ncbi:thioredoxin domain-containing protein [Thiomicrorhabdus sp.]|uniref:thioredoxin domain-containing protein n=1 Tax=Thiomicrorhabdus sp. TaxID=2039724 RepID=UPI002AA8332E|nr:DUF255 domain-containing protein [Thiomicrorhabdus sp.]
MHGNDPVHWQQWSAYILKKAKQQNKLIFISSGYFACHWCHVMQHENYQNTQTAQFLNQHFISVKIDRELNPELDKALIEFAQKTTGHAGWPQHVILTPNGYPFAAFIYLPNKDLNSYLNRVIQLWETQPNKINQLAKESSKQQTVSDSQQQLNGSNQINRAQFRSALLTQVSSAKDDFSGGLKGTSKFPEAPLLNALLSIKELPKEIEEWLILTLEQMQSQHLIDHINGGFYRYTVDPEWQTPHFEKMTYTNALLAQTYLIAGQRWQRKDFLQTAENTLNYLQTQLYSADTKLYQSSQSALDRLNQEGGNYLFSKQTLQKRLNKNEYEAVYQAWSLDQPSPYDLGWLPAPFKPNNTWQTVKQKLKTPSTQIPKDTKSILGWNGLVLSTLSKAYLILNKEQYKKSADQLAQTLTDLIQTPKPPRALSQNGEFMGEANLQDYAFIKQGLTDYQAWSNNQNTALALDFLNQKIPNLFFGVTGWRYDSTPILPQQHGELVMPDNAISSPTAIVSCLKPKVAYQAQALLKAQAIQYASYLNNLNCINR